MRTVLRLVMAMLGLALVVVGLTAAVVVGSDDTVFNEPTTIDTGGTPMATASDLFSYRNLDLSVRASSPDGVFVAAGDPVDVADYLHGRAFYEVEEITRTGVRGEVLDLDREPVEVPAQQATFWTTTEQGEGTRSLSLAIDAPADRVVVAPLGEGPVTLSFGATIEGLFALTVAVAVLGVVLLLLGVFLVVRARRRRSTSPQPADPPTRSGAASLARVAALALVVPLAGCGSLPERVAYQPPTKVALTESEVSAMLADYDKRNNAAIKAAGGPRFDSSKWELADTGPLLDADVFSTFEESVLKGRKKKSAPLELEHEGLGVLAGHFDSYPMWAIVATEDQSRGKEKRTKKEQRDDESYVDLSLFTRESAVSDWLHAVSAAVERADVPDPVDDAAVLTGRELAEAKRALAVQRRFLETGRGDWEADQETLDLRTYVSDSRKQEPLFDNFLTTAQLSDETHRLFALEVDGGVLAMASYALRSHARFTSGQEIGWASPYDKIRTHTYDDELVVPYVATTAIFIADDGKATPLGTTRREILTSSADGMATGR